VSVNRERALALFERFSAWPALLSAFSQEASGRNAFQSPFL
jgi:hypothetical protein